MHKVLLLAVIQAHVERLRGFGQFFQVRGALSESVANPLEGCNEVFGLLRLSTVGPGGNLVRRAPLADVTRTASNAGQFFSWSSVSRKSALMRAVWASHSAEI